MSHNKFLGKNYVHCETQEWSKINKTKDSKQKHAAKQRKPRQAFTEAKPKYGLK